MPQLYSAMGYYDDVIFHRIVRDFIVQTGDPTGTGTGGESIYDEFHSRLRFSHRGLLAMANTGPNTNTSQFFFTLSKTEELTRQNTIFGKVVGDTIFNLLKMGELEVDKTEKPLYPPRIIGTNVLSNPFDDIVPRTTAEERMAAQKAEAERLEKEQALKKPKTKKLNLNLLSFDDLPDSQETPAVSKSQKIKSMHDAIQNDPRLSKEVAVDLSAVPIVKESKLDALKSAMKRATAASATQEEIKKLQKDIRAIGKPPASDSSAKDSASKQKSSGSHLVSDLRSAYLKSGKAVAGRKKTGSGSKGEDALAKLEEFQNQLRGAAKQQKEQRSAHDSELRHGGTQPADGADEWECDLHFIKGCESCRDTFGEEKDDDDSGWMTATLKFAKQTAANVYQAKVDDYSVIDPREELSKTIL
eukprot:jgi/Hompol1/7046/HPOL_000467-RA